MTTAMAVFPPVERPPLLPLDEDPFPWREAPEVEEDFELSEPVVLVGELTLVAVTVTTTADPPDSEGDWVTTEVYTCVLGLAVVVAEVLVLEPEELEGASVVVEGCVELDGAVVVVGASDVVGAVVDVGADVLDGVVVGWVDVEDGDVVEGGAEVDVDVGVVDEGAGLVDDEVRLVLVVAGAGVATADGG